MLATQQSAALHARELTVGSLGGHVAIVSGAGASTTSLRDRGNQVFFQDATVPGFLYVVIDGNTLTGEMRDKYGALQFTRTITR